MVYIYHRFCYQSIFIIYSRYTSESTIGSNCFALGASGELLHFSATYTPEKMQNFQMHMSLRACVAS